MSSSNPPNPYTPSTYNPSAWELSSQNITTDYLDANYLRYNYAQGVENFVGIVNIGSLTQNGASQFGTAGSAITIPNCIADYSAVAGNDSSTKIPTTAWVQTAITAGSGLSIPVARYFINNLSNTQPIPSPAPTITFANIASKNYWDGIVFRVVITIQNNYSSLSGQDPNSVLNFDSTFSAVMTIFPKAFIASTNPPIYFNNAIGNTNNNTTYAPVSSAMSPYVANGRPYWSSGIVNDSNIVACMTPSFTNNGSTSSLILNFPAINWGGSTTLNYSMVFELLNSGRYAQTDITTQNFNLNF